jgi:hypothetical protein
MLIVSGRFLLAKLKIVMLKKGLGFCVEYN